MEFIRRFRVFGTFSLGFLEKYINFDTFPAKKHALVRYKWHFLIKIQYLIKFVAQFIHIYFRHG